MAVLIELRALNLESQPVWLPHSIIGSQWDLYQLEWIALHFALHETPSVTDIYEFPPYTVEGEEAFRQLLSLRARYLDRYDEGVPLEFSVLLASSTDVFLVTDQKDACHGESVERLFCETDQLFETLYEMKCLSTTDVAGRAWPYEPALEQALALREGCRAATTLRRPLRLRSVANQRPIDAPIFEYTAAVEGFATIQHIETNRAAQSVTVWLLSGYIYVLTFGSISFLDGVEPPATVIDASKHEGAVMRVTFDNGLVSDWPWSRILTICEPRYLAFDAERGCYAPRRTDSHNAGCRRLAPL